MALFNRPKSLTELVAENLKERIVNGEFDLGEQLSEAKIAKELEVSRTPVREAINRLEMEGLLVVEPQRGSFVFDLEPDELDKLIDARVCLETAALKFAMQTNSKRLHAELDKSVQEMNLARDSGNDAEYLRQDTIFHQCIFDCANNRFLNDAYQTIALKVSAVRNRLGRHPQHMSRSHKQHIELVKSVKQGDFQNAFNVLENHIDKKSGSYWSEVTEKVKTKEEALSATSAN
jgi:DNA-binding GntR family transcriptional regulator